jgi:hypothetical protein
MWSVCGSGREDKPMDPSLRWDDVFKDIAA